MTFVPNCPSIRNGWWQGLLQETGEMHLHLLRPGDRGAGRGTELVRQSADVFVDLFRLKHLFCEPHAFNVAPNRTLQRAGFKYLSTQWGTPAALDFEQVTNLWVFGGDHGHASL